MQTTIHDLPASTGHVIWHGPALMLALLCAGSGCLGALEDGVYPTRLDSTLGERLAGPLAARSLCAQDNANTQFMLTIPIPAIPGVDGFHHVVVLQGRALPVVAVGSLDRGEEISVRLDASACDAAQRLFAIHAWKRSHPGYAIDGSFTPEPATATVSAPMQVRFQLRNVGNQPFSFTVGGRQRGVRDNQFAFAATRDRTSLAPLVAWDFGGLMHTQVVAPGGTYETTVDLSSWFPDDQPGFYDLSGSFSFEVIDAQTSQTIWEDTLTRAFTLRVVAKEPPAAGASSHR